MRRASGRIMTSTLGDILGSLGVSEDSWTLRETNQEKLAGESTSAGQVWDGAWDELGTLITGVSDEEAPAMKEALANAVLSKKPDHIRLANLYDALANVLSVRGDTEGAARLRGKGVEIAARARGALLTDHRDPRDLCCLGRALMERCEASELPLCEDNFLGSIFDFGGGDALRIDYFCFVDPAVETFTDEPETVNLAIQAFGLAWFFYRERSTKKSEAWRALQALDGLRAAFLHTRNVEALQAVSEAFWDWVEDWDLPSGVGSDKFLANFRSSDAYVYGRLHRDPANRRVTGQKLANQLTDTWERLPQLSREYLINAEILFEHLDKKGDWSSAVNEYSKAIEVLLRERLGRRLDEGHPTSIYRVFRSAIDQARGRETRRYSRVSLSTFSQALAQVGPRLKQQRLNQVGNDLEKLVRVRSRAAHAVGVGEGTPWKISRQECEQVRDVCLGRLQGGLVRLLANHDW